ncbi:ABC transporter permease [Pontibacter qinzhouensis]|uniref:ABC transporter permease n=1 Tax=Pontibacter qinzhouensis TaxID=2603253 RepID=A0A5C8IZ23_9BACT|nr:ABC transporter permease [Pontibacter qinzhouensis]TXK26897.1 ABC transporter permease [Pontibacter qinzhouensis]
MVALLFKRLFHGLVALWLIATLVFLLSRLLPGSSGSENILLANDTFYTGSSSSSRELAYRAYLRRTGLDKPTFYFTIGTSVEPDTLHTIYPEADRLLLQKLAWQFGSWPDVVKFFTAYKALHQNLTQLQEPKLLAHLQSLHRSVDPDVLLPASQRLRKILNGQHGSVELEQATRKLITKQQPYNALLPQIRWHGSQNQYHQWLTEAVQGNLGNSYRDSGAVTGHIGQAISTTWWILLLSMTLTTLLAVELSILFVRKRGAKWRRAILPFLFFTDRIPLFILALLLLILFASPDFLQLFPVYGMGTYIPTGQTWLQNALNMLPFMVLPIICLVLVNLPYVTNQFYSSLADVSEADYIRTAKAKGLSEGKIIRQHMLRNALFPIITLLSDFLPTLVAGVVVIETIFAIPGVGRLLIESVLARDYPVLVGVVLVVALFKVMSHFISDLLYGLADPRIRQIT